MNAYLLPFLERIEEDNDFLLVDEDGQLGMENLVRHLLDLGHRCFGVITPPSNFTFTQFRLDGIRHGLAQAGIAIDPPLLLEGDLTQRAGYRLGMQLLNHPQPPTAIIACNDLMAYGVISAAQERGSQ